jgi:aspartate carbamoyltransferase catalytic subunit
MNIDEKHTNKNMLDLDSFSQKDFKTLFLNTDSMMGILSKDIKKIPALRGKSIVTLFFEPSTRTRASFEQAGKILNADVINISSMGSSVTKGESLHNTALTIQSMKCDIIIIRHPDSGAPYFLSKYLNNTIIINAGDGMHAHPTQALLDLYIMQKHLKTFKNKKVVIVGDLLHSRVARSNIWGLITLGADITVCGPRTLLPQDWFKYESLPYKHPFNKITIETKIENALHNADVIMALRIQKERQVNGLLPSMREYSKLYGITDKRMQIANDNAIVMHPGPVNEGIEIDSDVVHGNQSVIQKQVTTGVAIRMALLYTLCVGTYKNESE